MKRFYEQHSEKINYLLVGGWNTLFGFLAFALLYYWLGRAIHYVVLLVIANLLSISNAYISYKLFVFRTAGNYLKEYLRFYVVYGVAFLLNIALLPLCVELFRLSPVIAQAGLMFINVVFSYFGHKNFSFRRPQ